MLYCLVGCFISCVVLLVCGCLDFDCGLCLCVVMAI